MARTNTQVINGTDCIGDSLNVINSNFENLDTVVTSLSNLKFGTVTPSTTAAGTQSTVTLLDFYGNIRGYIPVYSARV